MATASVSVESNEMECAVCHEQFTDPKLLPCGHLLCRLCLLSWLQSQVDAKCPLCHCIIVEPGEQAGKSVEDVVDGFPTDYVMAALVESQQLLNKDHVCKACVSQGATSLCLNCGDLLCSSCLTIHSRMAATRNHTAENLSSLTAEKLAANRRYIGTNQADDTFKLFCPTHGVAICHICATSQHGGHCPEVKDLEKKVKEARAVLAELASMLNAGEAELDKAISQLDQHLQETEKRTRTAIVEIETTCDRLESAIKACRRRLKELVLGARAEVDEAVQAGKTCLLQRRGKLTSHKRVIQRVQEVTFRDDPMDMTSVMKSRVDNLDCSVTLPADAKVVTMATLVIDPETVSSVEGRLLKLGQVMIVPADVSAQVPFAVPLFRFHENHGKNIVLSENHQSAERMGNDRNGGIVLSSKPMVINWLYEVQLLKREALSGQYLWTGVVTAAPDTLALPDNAGQWTSAAVVINKSSVYVNGKRLHTKVGQNLVDLPYDSRVGVMLDGTNSLHLFINGQDQGVAAPDLPQPCFAFFDLCGPYRQIKALPMKNVFISC